jgi:hypothetical protein
MILAMKIMNTLCAHRVFRGHDARRAVSWAQSGARPPQTQRDGMCETANRDGESELRVAEAESRDGESELRESALRAIPFAHDIKIAA